MVQPPMPHRRHARRVLVALIDHPAAFAAVAPAAALERSVATFAVIAVAERVGADELAFEPREESCADGHCRSKTPQNIRQRRRKTRATMAPHRLPVQATRSADARRADGTRRRDHACATALKRVGRCTSWFKRLKLRPSTRTPIVARGAQLSSRSGGEMLCFNT